MSYLFSFISLIFILDVPKVFSALPGLGPMSCVYYGNVDSACRFPVVPARDLPLECTSFIMDGLTMQISDYTVHYKTNKDYQKYLNIILSLDKPVFLFYGQSLADWGTTLGDLVHKKAPEEMKKLKPYLDTNCKGISGLIVKDMDILGGNDYNATNLMTAYLEIMRSSLSGMAIGVSFGGSKLIDASCANGTDCLDLRYIDKVIDFYVLNATYFNPCLEEFKCGITPVSGKAAHTLDMIPDQLETIKVPKNKVHILFRGSPAHGNWKLCTTTYQQMCLKPPINITYCEDSTQSLMAQGKFVAANLAGFIIENIDLLDPNGDCGCSHRFPAFFYLLHGFKNDDSIPPCSKFDIVCDAHS